MCHAMTSSIIPSLSILNIWRCGGLTALPLVKAEVPFNKLEAFISDRLYQRRYFPAGGLPVRGFSLTVPGRRSNVKHLCLDNGQKPSKAFLTSEITIKQANKMKSRKWHAFESIMMPFSCSFRTINLRSWHLVRHLEVSGINMRTLHDGKFLLLFPRRPSESGAPERGTPDFKWRGWSRDFLGFEIFDSRILLGRKNWQVYFWVAWFSETLLQSSS